MYGQFKHRIPQHTPRDASCSLDIGVPFIRHISDSLGGEHESLSNDRDGNRYGG
jgi:hypothetical protein